MKRKFLLMLLCCIGPIMFPISTFAVQTHFSGYVGDEFTLVQPSVSILATKIKSVTWSGQYSDGISCYETSTGLKVRITSYFEYSKTITCRVKYEWSNGSGTYTSDATESYRVTCNPVTINVQNENMTMKVGQTQDISYSLSPSKNVTLTFKSSNYSVATVDNYGEVKAVGTGTATITIEQNMGYDAKCYVTVTSPVAATSISLPATANVDVYSSKMLYPTLKPSDANPTLTWKSEKTSIASVDQNGKVTGNKPGTTNVTVTTDNGLSATCAVTVKDVDRTPQQFDIADEFSKKTIYVGDTWRPTYTVTPSYANYTLQWTSSNNSVAKVSTLGEVTALRPGTAKITGSIDGTQLKDSYEVTVKGIPNVLTIWLANGKRSDIKLSEQINMTFEEEKFIVKSATVDVEYNALDVKKFSLESDGSEETGVQKLMTGETTGTMNFDGNAIRLSGFSPNSIVQLFTVNGQAEGGYRMGQDGSLTISVDGLTRGIHIVKIESITYKIIKK
ncbi:MAG: Ig-like domain-containing protein [Bacteroidaceae bacterium]|nr:Ig-like domain-containing protein [Bacteroidaceae bacterium]